MAGKKHWEQIDKSHGIREIHFSNYRWFFEFILQEILDYKTYVFRGQSDSAWLLNSTLDRSFRKLSKVRTDRSTNSHLERFKYATRGRLPQYSLSSKDSSEWWALGQHHGLATPLLDWTESPFVALFFAFESERQAPSGKRVVYGVAKYVINQIKKNKEAKSESDIVEIVNPLSHDNARLVNQSGLFLSMPPALDLEEYIVNNTEEADSNINLFKCIIEDRDRPKILQYLNRMNINKLTLFPDISGAAEHANMTLMIDKY